MERVATGRTTWQQGSGVEKPEVKCRAKEVDGISEVSRDTGEGEIGLWDNMGSLVYFILEVDIKKQNIYNLS